MRAFYSAHYTSGDGRLLISTTSLGSCFLSQSNQFFLLYWPAPSSPAKYLQKVTDSFVLHHLIAEAQIRIDSIPQTSAFSYLRNVAINFKVSDYSVYRLLGNAYRQRELSNGNPRLLSNLTKDQSMICNKFPARHGHTSFSKLAPIIFKFFSKFFCPRL